MTAKNLCMDFDFYVDTQDIMSEAKRLGVNVTKEQINAALFDEKNNKWTHNHAASVAQDAVIAFLIQELEEATDDDEDQETGGDWQEFKTMNDATDAMMNEGGKDWNEFHHFPL